MPVVVVDDFELIEIHEHQHRRLSCLSGRRHCFRQTDVEPAIVEQTGQVIFARQLVSAFAVERVLQRERRVTGEDLQQRFVAVDEWFAVETIDQLQHATDMLADVDGHADDRVGLVSQALIEFGVEEDVALYIRGDVRRPRLVDLTGDSMLRGETLADEIAPGIAECGDEHQLILVTRCHFAERIVQQNRARFRRNELIRLLENLPQHQIEIDVALEGQTALVPLEKALELRSFQRVKLDHCHRPAPIIGFPRFRPRMPLVPGKCSDTPRRMEGRAAGWPRTRECSSSRTEKGPDVGSDGRERARAAERRRRHLPRCKCAARA